MAVVPFALACNASKCSKPSDCNTDGGELCLYPAGGGCSSQGLCEKQHGCSGTAGPPTVLCSCEGKQLAIQCVPDNGITDRTVNGACMADGGSDE